jgi:hypothetical protein
LLITNGSIENFISQMLITRSARSIKRSICAPDVSVLPDHADVSVLPDHAEVSVFTPPMLRLSLIWEMCSRQTCSKA